MPDADIKISIRSDISLVPFVGRALSALIGSSGMSQQRVSTFELAVVEVVTNSIEHAYEFKPDQKVDLLFKLTSESIEVSVRDFGAPLGPEVIERYTSKDVEIAVPDARDKDSLPVSGWGASLVATLCDEVRYEHKESSNVLTLVCNLDDNNALLKTG